MNPMKILCMLGLHYWQTTDGNNVAGQLKCKRCGKMTPAVDWGPAPLPDDWWPRIWHTVRLARIDQDDAIKEDLARIRGGIAYGGSTSDLTRDLEHHSVAGARGFVRSQVKTHAEIDVIIEGISEAFSAERTDAPS